MNKIKLFSIYLSKTEKCLKIKKIFDIFKFFILRSKLFTKNYVNKKQLVLKLNLQ